MYQVLNEEALLNAIDMIQILLTEKVVEKVDKAETNYMMPYSSTEELIGKGLIRISVDSKINKIVKELWISLSFHNLFNIFLLLIIFWINLKEALFFTTNWTSFWSFLTIMNVSTIPTLPHFLVYFFQKPLHFPY